ncbi:MAG: hypothetical protein ACRDJI_09135 [Actinomycetota bacterium]
MRVAAALFTALSVGTAAAGEVCEPLPPNEWSGEFLAGAGGGFVGTTVFERQGCTWNGLDALNGFDALVFDIDGYQTLPVTIVPGESPGESVNGFFLNDRCERSGFWPTATKDAPVTVAIPEQAKWLVAIPPGGGFSQSVTITSAGRECAVEEPEPKKKKKKKKKG